MRFYKLFLLSGILLSGATLHAQSIGPSAIDAAGASFSSAGVTHEYAIGQVVGGNTYISSTLVVTPGVLQPAATTSIRTNSIAAGDLSVYPSPIESTLFLQPAFKGAGLLQYRLYDAAGKLVLDNEAKLQSGTERQSVNVDAIAAGQYMLQVNWVQAGTTTAGGYKIQKLK